MALASLAGKTKIERLFDRLVLPTVFDDVAFRHLPQQVGAAAGRVLFFARDTIAWAHDSASVATALPDSHAAQSCGGKAALILRKLEMRLWLPGIVARAEAKIFVELVRLDQLARVHLPVGIP